MSTSDSIVSSQTKQSSWRKSDTTWTLGLFGTAIGAGVLFFPIRAGFGGLIPILLMLVLAYPIAFYCHRALARLCLSGSNPSGNITETVEEHFGKTGGVVITFLYFFAICPLLWIYGVTITNTFMTFWENQLGFAPLNRGFVALFLLLLMAFVIWFGKDLMVKVMSYLVWPFIASLVLISLSLIPYWNSAVIDQVLRLHLDRRFCFRQPGRKPSPQSADECNAILWRLKLTQQMLCHPLNNNFMRHPAKAKFLCCNGY